MDFNQLLYSPSHLPEEGKNVLLLKCADYNNLIIPVQVYEYDWDNYCCKVWILDRERKTKILNLVGLAMW